MRSSQPSASQDSPAPRSTCSWQSETDAALLQRLAGPGADGVGERLLSRHGGLREVFHALGEAGPGNPAAEVVCLQRLAAASELCRRRLLRELVRGEALTSPASTVEFLQSHLLDRRREVFIAVFLDTRHRVLNAEELFQGSIDGACVYPRVVADRALRLGAAAVIVAHNHPSGIAEPSLADQAITRRLKDALALLEIRLLDHFIIGSGTPVSLAGRGLL